MVSWLPWTLLAAATLWERLSPVERARLGMALLAFVLLFLAVIGFVMLLGRMTRREIRKPLPPIRDLTDAWARKPISSATPVQNNQQDVSSDDSAGA